MQREHHMTAVQQVHQVMIYTMFHHWSIWPLAMYVNFRFVPLPWQVLYTSSVGMLWDIHMAHSTSPLSPNILKPKSNDEKKQSSKCTHTLYKS